MRVWPASVCGQPVRLASRPVQRQADRPVRTALRQAVRLAAPTSTVREKRYGSRENRYGWRENCLASLSRACVRSLSLSRSASPRAAAHERSRLAAHMCGSFNGLACIRMPTEPLTTLQPATSCRRPLLGSGQRVGSWPKREGSVAQSEAPLWKMSC